jgi:hypothetical protein
MKLSSPEATYPPVLRYTNGRTRTTAIVFCGEVFWLTLIGAIHVDGAASKEFLAVLAALALAAVIRASYSFVLVLEPDQMTMRTLTQTRSWRYCELRSVELMATPLRSPNRTLILLNLLGGRSYQFTTLEEAPEYSPEFDAAIAELNVRIFHARLHMAKDQR